MLKALMVAAATIAVTVAERTPAVAHGHEKVKIIEGIAFAAPFILVLLLAAWRESRAKAKAAAPQRTSYSFGSPAPRRRG